MTVAYATTAQLDSFLAAGSLPAEASRLLERASELLDDVVTAAFTVDAVTGLPTVAAVAAALRDAACAQVEFWLEVGEEHEVAGMAGRQVRVGSLSIDRLPPRLAPRARGFLQRQGLLRVSVSSTPAQEFFAVVPS